MIDATTPASLSVYRGQARTGKGEGPGKTILHGEQYLEVAPELYDNHFLDSIRPWMTLDSDPADHQRLNEQLESWSVFPVSADYLVVVRLVPAGSYDRRAAYFAHGRAWKTSSLPPTVDPGMFLGRSESFDEPWRDETQSTETDEGSPSLVRPEQIAAETETAALFLGNLFQAMVENYPLIVAAPIADFVSGGPLHALISLTRAGLPSDLRRHCRVRVYSRSPDLFLGLGADLVVVPEDAAGSALMARPAATLLDRRGSKMAGKELDSRALDYATAVVERAIGIPDGLTLFTTRVNDHFDNRLPSAAETRAVQVIYNLAFAFAGPAERRGELLRRYLPRAADKFGPGLSWNKLIAEGEWSEFPREALLDQLLMDSGGLSEGTSEFLRAVESGVSRLQLRVDERLGEWWDAADPRKVRRLIELLAHDPPLVSRGAAAERTAEVSLEQLAAVGPIHSVLAAEAQNGLLSLRASESSELAVHARNRDVFDVLSRAATNGAINVGWAQTYVERAPAGELTDKASRWLQDPEFFHKWNKVPELLLDRLRSFETPPSSLASAIKNAGHGLDPVKDMELYLRLADVLVRIAPADGRVLMQRLWNALPSLSEAQTHFLEDRLFNPTWPSLDGTHLDLRILLQLALHFQKQESDSRLYDVLDSRMRADPGATTDVLVREGWWYFWRRRTQLQRSDPADAEILKRSALAWLGSDAWTSGRREATLEAWDTALADLPQTISGAQMADLRDSGGRRSWPWIPPFEEEQLDRLVARASDLGALAELAEAASADWMPADGRSVHEYVLTKSALKENLPSSALAWLLKPGDGRVSKPLIDVGQSAYLYRHAGHRAKEEGLQARIESVSVLLQRDASAALEAAGNPNLWSEPRFLSRIADWVGRQESLQAISQKVAERLEANIAGEPSGGPRAGSEELTRELFAKGFPKIARLLNPTYQQQMQVDRLVRDVVSALLKPRADDPCWRELARVMGQSSELTRDETHPLRAVAKHIRGDETLRREEKQKLARQGWRVFDSAAEENQGLMMPLNTAPFAAANMLPLLDFAASMLGAGTLGMAVLQLAFAVPEPSWRENSRLWQSLLRAMRRFKRYDPFRNADDREHLAVALLFASLERPKERDALSRALEQDAGDEWKIPFEFGVSTS